MPATRTHTTMVGLILAVVVGACGGGTAGDQRGTGVAAQGSAPAAAGRCTAPAGAVTDFTAAPGWKVGDKRVFTISKQSERDGHAQDKGTGTATVTVLAGSPGQPWHLRWEAKTRAVDVGALVAAGADTKLVNKLADLSLFMVEYSTDAAGAFVRVENLDEVRRQAEAMVDALTPVLVDALHQGEEVAASARRLLLSDAFLQSTLVEDVLVLHGLYGLALKPGQVTEFSWPLPNPFGGDPFPATARAEVDGQPDADGCLPVELVVIPEPGPLGQILAGSRDARPSGERAAGAVDVVNTLRFRYDAGSGWIRSVAMESRIRMGDRSRIDTTVIETALVK